VDARVIARFESTLPADDDHPYRTGPWRPNVTEQVRDCVSVVRSSRRRARWPWKWVVAGRADIPFFRCDSATSGRIAPTEAAARLSALAVEADGGVAATTRVGRSPEPKCR
jgi:hypothetical protein